MRLWGLVEPKKGACPNWYDPDNEQRATCDLCVLGNLYKMRLRTVIDWKWRQTVF